MDAGVLKRFGVCLQRLHRLQMTSVGEIVSILLFAPQCFVLYSCYFIFLLLLTILLLLKRRYADTLLCVELSEP